MKKITKINDVYVGNALGFVFADGCHKFYILEDEADVREARQMFGNGVEEPLDERLIEKFRHSCPLRFIKTWKLEHVVEQGTETVEFTFEDETVAIFDAHAEYE